MFRALTELFSIRDLRNAVLGAVVLVGGLGLSGLTLWAHQTGNMRLAGISAGISLVFVLLILIFVVPPLARNAGREASQMNLPFEFTTGGAIMVALIVVVGFSAWNTGNNLLFLVLSFMIAAMIVGFFAGAICLKKVDVTMRFPETIFAGEPTPILVTLTNRKRIVPAFSVVVEVRGKERERSVVADELDALLPRWIASRLGRPPLVRRTLGHFVYIKARSSQESRKDQTFPIRGRLMIKDFEISTKFPFGFFRHRRRLPAREAELIVFPRLVPVDPSTEMLPLDTGEHTAAKRGFGRDLLALRDYQPHDDIRHIDWKATARTQQLVVREFAAEDEKRVTVFLDTRTARDPSDRSTLRERLAAEQSGKPTIASDEFELCVEMTASLLAHFSSEKAQTRLVIDGDEGDFGSGRLHLNEELRRLAIAEPNFASSEPAAELERILDRPDDSHRFLVTSSETANLPPETLQRLKIIGF